MKVKKHTLSGDPQITCRTHGLGALGINDDPLSGMVSPAKATASSATPARLAHNELAGFHSKEAFATTRVIPLTLEGGGKNGTLVHGIGRSAVFFSSPATAEDIAIIKTWSQGSVSIKRAGQLLPAQLSDNLEAGDILITAKDSRIGVIFHDGSVLTLEQNSLLRITAFEFKPIENKFRFNLNLSKGATLFESGKIGTLAPDKFSLDVPGGSIGIRGTKFLVEVR